MQGWALGVVMVGALAGCTELEAEPSFARPGAGGSAGVAGGATSSPGGAGGGAASNPSGAAAPYLEEAGSLAHTPTPCLDSVAPRDDAVKPVALPGSAGAAGFDVDGEPSTGITVFDRSGSMSAGWSVGEVPEGEATDAVFADKWTAASDALVASIVPVEHRVTIGAIQFPLGGNCDVAPLDDEGQFGFLPGPDFIAAWEERHGSYPPSGATPLQDAFVRVEQALEQACVDGELDERHYVILLTDGEPNCGTDLAVVEAMAAHWLAHGIATYVFGLPGSEPAQEVLDRIAVAGGTSAIVVPGTPSELGSSMGAAR
ncbi:MAG: VWA domain-containing protein [Polyangiaceae bacterium]|nr:VWA domain-containing protein [Polyangiaceae bacterium]